MRAPLRVLLVAPEPAPPSVEALRRAGYDPHVHHVGAPEALAEALEREGWDAALIVQGCEGLGPLEALAWLRQRRPSTPAFVVADAPDAAAVVALIEAGARDVMAPGDAARLGAAVARAVHARREAVRRSSAAAVDPDSAFHELAEHIPIGLYRTTDDGRILYANPALARILGRTCVEDLLEDDVLGSIAYPRQAFFEEIRRTGRVRNLEVRWEHPDGRVIYTRENARAVRDTEGRVLYYEGTMEDVTEERVALETEQRRVGQLEAIVRFSAAVDAALSAEDLHAAIVRAVEETLQADAAVLVQREDGRFEILAWSEAIPLEGVHACSEHEVWRSYPAHTQPLLLRDLERVSEEQMPGPLRALMQAASFRALGSFPLLYHGRPLGMVVAFFRQPHTFTEGELRIAETLTWHVAVALSRWRAEAALRQSEARYRTISDLASDYAFAARAEPDGRTTIEWATQALRRISGYDLTDLRGLGGPLRLVHPADRARVLATQRRLLELGEPEDLEFRIITKTGEERWVHHRGRPERDAQGRVARVYHVGQDVTERKRFEDELIEAREQAEAMARLKSAFLTNMSHEIRTPLTGILGFAGVLADEVDPAHREFVGLIEKSGRRLLDTLNSVLDLARLEADQLQVELEPLDVVAFAEEAVRLLQPLAEEKGIGLRFTAARQLMAPVDGTCLGRILNNLVGNAIKFTERGQVEVEVVAEDEEVRIRVRDTGIGIDPAFLPELFEEFKQESMGQARSHEGSGLGLAITKRLVELMGGRIAVESEKGAGSVFTVAFPYLSEMPHGDGQAEEAQSEGSEMLILEAVRSGLPEPVPSIASAGSDGAEGAVPGFRWEPIVEALLAEGEPAAEHDIAPENHRIPEEEPIAEPDPAASEALAGEPTSAEGLRVLVVEAAPEKRAHLAEVAEVEAVAEPRAVLEALTRQAFDVLVLDVNLGGRQSGADILRVAQTLPGCERLAAVALAAGADSGTRRRLLEAGFGACVGEAYTRERLLAALETARAR